MKWMGVEWYYQGSKFKEENPNFYRKFSLDSDTELSKNPVMAKAAGGKTGMYTRTTGEKVKKKERMRIRPKSIQADKTFFTTSRVKEEMAAALRAKFTQHDKSKEILLATAGLGPGLPARLQHHVRGKPAEIWYHLMKIRKELKTRKDSGDNTISEIAKVSKKSPNLGVEVKAAGSTSFDWDTGNFK